MSSVIFPEYETMYHKEDDSYFIDYSMNIPTGVISATNILNNSYSKSSHSKHERSFLPPVSFGNNLHVVTELDETNSGIDTVIETSKFGGMIFCIMSQTVMIIDLVLLINQIHTTISQRLTMNPWA